MRGAEVVIDIYYRRGVRDERACHLIAGGGRGSTEGGCPANVLRQACSEGDKRQRVPHGAGCRSDLHIVDRVVRLVTSPRVHEPVHTHRVFAGKPSTCPRKSYVSNNSVARYRDWNLHLVAPCRSLSRIAPAHGNAPRVGFPESRRENRFPCNF